MTNEGLIYFPPSGEPEVKGLLKSPGKISIRYDPYRMKHVFLSTSREARDGMIYMYIAFNGAADAAEVAMLKRKRAGESGPVIDLSPVIYKGNVPLDVHEIQIWFKGTTARSGISWDSKCGSNYRFNVAKQ